MEYGIVTMPWGRLGITCDDAGIHRVVFDPPPAAPLIGQWAEAFAAYLAGQPFAPDLPVHLTGVPPFTRAVLTACRTIPYGTTCSYTQLAAMLGRPRAARAVGQALARNPVPVVIPCHRVLGGDGRLTGFLGGIAWKRHLLWHEGAVRNMEAIR